MTTTTKHFSFIFILFMFFISGTRSTHLIFKNNCPYTVWPGTSTGSGPALALSGFILESGATFILLAHPGWSGRLWGRTSCSKVSYTQKFICATADCASGQVSCNGAVGIPPATLAEFTLNGGNNLDFYDISLIDGYNLPISVVPTNGQHCNSTGCPADVNKSCPEELQQKNSHSGDVEACKSACIAFNKPEFCCTGKYGTPQACPPTKYSEIFKRLCPQAYSYAYDDKTSTFTCINGSIDYTITLCP